MISRLGLANMISATELRDELQRLRDKAKILSRAKRISDANRVWNTMVGVYNCYKEISKEIEDFVNLIKSKYEKMKDSCTAEAGENETLNDIEVYDGDWFKITGYIGEDWNEMFGYILRYNVLDFDAMVVDVIPDVLNNTLRKEEVSQILDEIDALLPKHYAKKSEEDN